MHDFLEGLLISEMNNVGMQGGRQAGRQAGRLDSSNVFPLQWFLMCNYAPVIL